MPLNRGSRHKCRASVENLFPPIDRARTQRRVFARAVVAHRVGWGGDVTLSKLQTLREWVESGAGKPTFERYDQISWFVRSHREALIASQTFLPGRGTRPTYVTPQFAQTVARLLKAEATR